MGGESNHCVLVRLVGRDLDSLRAEASRFAREFQTDWYAEPQSGGTAFCFDNSHVSTVFRAYCAKYAIPCEDSS
jgi:hypothetical protein